MKAKAGSQSVTVYFTSTSFQAFIMCKNIESMTKWKQLVNTAIDTYVLSQWMDTPKKVTPIAKHRVLASRKSTPVMELPTE